MLGEGREGRCQGSALYVPLGMLPTLYRNKTPHVSLPCMVGFVQAGSHLLYVISHCQHVVGAE